MRIELKDSVFCDNFSVFCEEPEVKDSVEVKDNVEVNEFTSSACKTI